jgi:hypothetical protein
MKTLIAVLALSLAAPLSAQEPGMTPEMQQRMQDMQKNMGAMQKCFASIDQKALEKLQVRAKEMEAEVKRLCAAGERDAAQSKAMAYGLEMSRDPELQKMRKCGEGFMAMPLPGQFFPKDEQEQASRQHICD